MEFQVLDIEERGGRLRVKIRSKYGEEIIPCPLEDKFLDIRSGKPGWLHSVRQRLDFKYKEMEKKASPSTEFAQFINKKYDSEKIEDFSSATLSKKKDLAPEVDKAKQLRESLAIELEKTKTDIQGLQLQLRMRKKEVESLKEAFNQDKRK